MSKAPAFQFYPDDFMGGKPGLMRPEETHVYIWLLCLEWNQTGFLYDPAQLARWCRVSERQFLKAWKVVGECFKYRDDGRLYNARLDDERAKQEEWRRKSSEGGKKSAEARAQAKANGGSTTLEPPYQPNGNTPSPTPSPFPLKDVIGGSDTSDLIALTTAANQGITSRYGEQPSPLVWSAPGAREVAEQIAVHEVPLVFAVPAVYSAAASCAAPRPPKSLKYFLPQVLRAWEEERARNQAGSLPPPNVIPLTPNDRRKADTRATIEALLAPIPKEMR